MTKFDNELHALHRLLTTARTLAYGNENPKKVAAILDDAEYLVTVLWRKEDPAEEYNLFLRHLGDKFPELAGVAEDYAQAAPLSTTDEKTLAKVP